MSEFKFSAEAMAFNLCNDFPVEFVEKNERFARAVIDEYERQRAALNPDPVKEAAHDLLEALTEFFTSPDFDLIVTPETNGAEADKAANAWIEKARSAIRKATEG